MMFVLFCCFTHMEGHTAYMQPCLFPKVLYAGYAVQEGKKHAGPQPQKWVRVAAQAKRTFEKVQGCPCCSAASMRGWTLTIAQALRQCKDMCTASGSVQDPERNPRHPETSKLTYFRTLQSSYARKGSKTGFRELQRWFLGSGAMFACTYPHTSRGSSVKLAIRLGLAAKRLRMCSQATKAPSCISHWLGRKAA